MNKLNKEVYKLAGYYIKCKQANLDNIDFLKKLSILSKKYDKSIFYLCALFLHSKIDIIQEAIKVGVYFDETLFEISDNLKELNKKNKFKGAIYE